MKFVRRMGNQRSNVVFCIFNNHLITVYVCWQCTRTVEFFLHINISLR
jgi:hypothetical protein